jgi:hypothetical protein
MSLDANNTNDSGDGGQGELFDKGRIRNPLAYAQGKMLDHSSWNLPGGISPSDFDFVLEVGGAMLVAELKRSSVPLTFRDLSTGQRIVFETMLRQSRRNVFAIVWHDVGSPLVIDSRNDIAGGLAVWDGGERQVSLTARGWQRLVEGWGRIGGLMVAHLEDERRARQGGAA